ncbi:MAG TPA: YciI family protein [Burkholderiaceae bacterium]|nr:YciI family protein [Burkholderiaceae bacterium]
MPYMLLIMEQAERRRARSEEEGRVLYERMVRFTEDLRARGLLTASDSLRSDVDGVRVRVRDGRRTLVDGPFSESKEIVGGFFLLTCEKREEAVAIASRCPAAEWATVEVRGFGPCFAGN